MTPRSFWMIIIRIIGIWIVLDSISVLSQFISYFFMFNSSNDWLILISSIGLLLITIICYFLVLYLCVFKTGWIIDKLKLDRGFVEEKFELKIHHSTILQIAVIVIGGILFIKVFPLFCKSLILYVKQSNASDRTYFKPEWSSVLFYFIETFISVYLMRNSRQIVNLIERQRRKLPRNQDADQE